MGGYTCDCNWKAQPGTEDEVLDAFRPRQTGEPSHRALTPAQQKQSTLSIAMLASASVRCYSQAGCSATGGPFALPNNSGLLKQPSARMPASRGLAELMQRIKHGLSHPTSSSSTAPLAKAAASGPPPPQSWTSTTALPWAAKSSSWNGSNVCTSVCTFPPPPSMEVGSAWCICQLNRLMV